MPLAFHASRPVHLAVDARSMPRTQHPLPLLAPPGRRASLTIEDLLSLVRTGSNNHYLRWWAHWNYPQSPTEMAISIMGDSGATLVSTELEAIGFDRTISDTGFIVYVCDRVDDDGHPFLSRL